MASLPADGYRKIQDDIIRRHIVFPVKAKLKFKCTAKSAFGGSEVGLSSRCSRIAQIARDFLLVCCAPDSDRF